MVFAGRITDFEDVLDFWKGGWLLVSCLGGRLISGEMESNGKEERGGKGNLTI